MKRFLSIMKLLGALWLAYVLYHSSEALAQESGGAAEQEIYVPALGATASFPPRPTGMVQEVSAEVGDQREGRRVGLLRGMWKKPRVSPLYLVNGTVCRFVNSSPICTTLATTGLGLNNGNNNNNGSNNNNNNNPNNLNNLSQFGNNQQFPLNQQQQQFSNRNINPNNQLYMSGNLPMNNNNNNQFNRMQPQQSPQQQQQQPQFVSSALNEEESQEVAVQDASSSVDSQQSQQADTQQSGSSPARAISAAPQAGASGKPLGVVLNRRPLLPLRLPGRQFHLG